MVVVARVFMCVRNVDIYVFFGLVFFGFFNSFPYLSYEVKKIVFQIVNDAVRFSLLLKPLNFLNPLIALSLEL